MKLNIGEIEMCCNGKKVDVYEKDVKFGKEWLDRKIYEKKVCSNCGSEYMIIRSYKSWNVFNIKVVVRLSEL